MSFNLSDIVGDIFYTDRKEKEAEERKNAELQDKVNYVYGTNSSLNSSRYNPFLDREGNLFNPYLNYQKLLDSSKVSNSVKRYITDATGLKQTQRAVQPIPASGEQTVAGGTTSSDGTSPSGSVAYTGTGDYVNSVGKRITDTSKYKNGAAYGQCVWYVLGRATERNGKNIAIGGNGNSMYNHAISESKVSASPENLRGNMLLCYQRGTSSAGQKYGHVIFIEDVVGDTVYYTEGGSGYHKNGTDGVVKTASRQQILNGVNSSGAKIGSDPVGLIDLSKY